MIELKNYQKKAITKLTEKIGELLDSKKNEICVFKAPTGSGKTLMVSETLKKLVNEKMGSHFSFIWISVRMLHEQSKEKLEQYYEDNKLIQCSYFEDLQNKQIDEKRNFIY